MKVVCGLGNPGGEYEATRHNVGWWVLDRARDEWGFPPFRRTGVVRVSEGRLQDSAVWLVKPLTYMNRSGAAVAPLGHLEGFDVAADLLVVVDDVALEPGRVRIRPEGSSGGHNGLKSIEASLRTRSYPRMRVGVGGPPPDIDMAEWVLSPFEPEEEERMRARLPELVGCVRAWVEQGSDVAANQCNG
jgi:peptidyl-tRNA hydrolase, PTH1 family